MADEDDAALDDPEDIEWNEMGTGAFQDQSNIELPARELKTIFVDVHCLYLRLKLHGCYENKKLNPNHQVGIMGIELFGHHLQKTAHNEHHDLIKVDKQKRIERLATAKRAGTARDRHLLEKDYVSEINRVVSMLQNKLNITSDQQTKHNINNAIHKIKEVSEEADLLTNTEKEAMEEHDDIYAEACEKHIINKYYQTAKLIGLQDILDQDQIDSIKLSKDEAKSKTKTTTKKVSKKATKKALQTD